MRFSPIPHAEWCWSAQQVLGDKRVFGYNSSSWMRAPDEPSLTIVMRGEQMMSLATWFPLKRPNHEDVAPFWVEIWELLQWNALHIVQWVYTHTYMYLQISYLLSTTMKWVLIIYREQGVLVFALLVTNTKHKYIGVKTTGCSRGFGYIYIIQELIYPIYNISLVMWPMSSHCRTTWKRKGKTENK